jgi:ubiquinone biosynthesis protein
VVLARATTHLAGGDEAGDTRALEADIGLVLTEGLGSGSFDPQAMSMMLDVMQRHGLEVPGPMTVLSRALLTLEGTLRTIDPTFNIAHEATALLPELADQQSDMLQEQLQKEVVRALPSLRTLPGHVEAIAVQLRRGSLSMRVERFAGADREVVDEWVDRVIFAGMGLLGMIASGVLLVAAALVHSDDDFATALQVIGFFGIIVTAVIQMRVVAQILRRGDAQGRRRV